MVVVALALLPMIFTGSRIARWEAAAFLAHYAAYVTYLLLAAAEHDALPALSFALLWFLMPMTALSLAALTAREIHIRRGHTSART